MERVIFQDNNEKKQSRKGLHVPTSAACQAPRVIHRSPHLQFLREAPLADAVHARGVARALRVALEHRRGALRESAARGRKAGRSALKKHDLNKKLSSRL